MIKGVVVRELEKHEDSRGFLYEILRPEHVNPVQKSFGQIYISAANPGEVKANHYHKKKKEWFLVIAGSGTIALQDIGSGERMELQASGQKPKLIFVPEKVAHAFKNTGHETMVILAYVTEPYNPEDDDTYKAELF